MTSLFAPVEMQLFFTSTAFGSGFCVFIFEMANRRLRFLLLWKQTNASVEQESLTTYIGKQYFVLTMFFTHTMCFIY